MATIGEILQEARTAKGVSASQAAAATRMKVQHVEALEADDFKRMAAPIYVKGFLRLYAEYLQLDPDPLIEMYRESLPDRRAPRPAPPRPRPARAAVSTAALQQQWLKWLRRLRALPRQHIQQALTWIGVLAVVFFVLFSLGQCARTARRERARRAPQRPGLLETPAAPWLPTEP